MKQETKENRSLAANGWTDIGTGVWSHPIHGNKCRTDALKAGERTRPEYSEFGPVWTVCPMERVPECESGTETVWLVVDLDYDIKNFCGKCIAECNSESDAHDIADSLNLKSRASLGQTQKREEKFAKDLFNILCSRGAILDKIDLRRIRQAFERHQHEVFSSVYQHPNAALDCLTGLVGRMEALGGAMEVNIQAGHEEEYPEMATARMLIETARK